MANQSPKFFEIFLKIKIKWSLDGRRGRVDDETRTGHVALFNKNRRSDWLIYLEYFCGSKFPVFVFKISDIWSITLGMFFFDKDAKWPFQITDFSSSLIFGWKRKFSKTSQLLKSAKSDSKLSGKKGDKITCKSLMHSWRYNRDSALVPNCAISSFWLVETSGFWLVVWLQSSSIWTWSSSS